MEEKKSKSEFIPKAYTFFMVPFYYDGEWEEIHKNISRWKPQQTEMYKEDILYPYIIELFKKDELQEDREKTATNRLKIYQLYTKDEGSKSEFFFDRIIGKKQVAILEQEASDEECYTALPFRFLNEGNYAPHLFVSPSARIGIMTLCVELGDRCSVQDLQQFNYCLHKRNEIANIIVEKTKLPNGKEEITKLDKRTKNYRIVCPSPESQKSLSDEEIMRSVAQYLSPSGYKELLNEPQNINNDHINWDLNFFTNFLLNTFSWKSLVKFFNKERMHVYTFCSIADTASSENELSTENISTTALRLSRVVNNKYLLPFDDLLRNGAMLQTYQNIYFSSAIEGTSMVCVEKDINKEFIANLQNMFNRQYLLIYLLVLIQRYTLLSIDRRLTEYDARNDDTDTDLWDLIKLICKIKVNCYYTDVSVYTHHSQFYQHCCKNLHIPETFKEIDEKVELLKITTDRRLQQLMEAQRKIQMEEAKRHQKEIERIQAKEKEDEERRKMEKEQEEQRLAKEKEEYDKRINEAKDEAERRQHILNWVVAILTIAQVIQASYEVISHFGELKMYLSLAIGVLGIALLVWLMWKDITDFIMRIRTR